MFPFGQDINTDHSHTPSERIFGSLRQFGHFGALSFGLVRSSVPASAALRLTLRLRLTPRALHLVSDCLGKILLTLFIVAYRT